MLPTSSHKHKLPTLHCSAIHATKINTNLSVDNVITRETRDARCFHTMESLPLAHINGIEALNLDSRQSGWDQIECSEVLSMSRAEIRERFGIKDEEAEEIVHKVSQFVAPSPINVIPS